LLARSLVASIRFNNVRNDKGLFKRTDSMILLVVATSTGELPKAQACGMSS
jgi:hypothetical protein